MRIIKKKTEEKSNHNDVSQDNTNNDIENSNDVEIPPPTKRRCIPPPNTGYNSDDEYGHSKSGKGGVVFSLFDEMKKKIIDEEAFEKQLNELNFEIIRTDLDGNCLFRSVADQIYGDQNMHDIVRKNCLDHIEVNRDYFSQFIIEDFDEYVKRKRKDKVFGNHLELQAIAEMYNRPIIIYMEGEEPIHLCQNGESKDEPPIRLSYHNRNHYNSVRDLNNPSIGVGLGLPDLVPGLADKMQMEEAKLNSLNDEYEKAILEQVKEESEQAEIDEILLNELILKESEKDYNESEIEEAILQMSMEEYYKSLAKNANDSK